MAPFDTYMISKLSFSLFNQLKPGGEIPAKGKKITLRVQNARDLTRDVIKVWMFPVYSNLHACAWE
jgi:hypothetical protein